MHSRQHETVQSFYLKQTPVTFRTLPGQAERDAKRRKILLCSAGVILIALALLFIANPFSERQPNATPEVTLQPAVAGASPLRATKKKEAAKKYIAITFDDGPSKYTRKVLKVLDKYDAHATFFELGSEIKRNKSAARAVIAQGSQIGSHTYSHKALTKMSNGKISRDNARMVSLIKSTTGEKTRYIRPPYGSLNKRVRHELKALGMRTILWDKDTRDWSRPGVKKIVERATHKPKNGDIILLHDGGGNRSQTLEALPQILKKLQAKGFVFCTVDDLYKKGVRK